MKVLVLLAILYATSLLIVCFGSEGNSTKSGDAPGEAAGCLLPYREKLDRLLTLDKASETAGRPKQQAVSKYNRVMKNASYHSMQYVWKTGRQKKMKVMGKIMTVPANDIVELHGLKEVTADYFNQSRRPPTQQQLAASQKEIDNAIEGKSSNPEANEKLRKLDEMKVGTQTQRATSGALNTAFAEAAKSYSEVTGLGQAAAWNSFENRLYILDDGVELVLTVDISNDSNVNREKAITLAKVLLTCR